MKVTFFKLTFIALFAAEVTAFAFRDHLPTWASNIAAFLMIAYVPFGLLITLILALAAFMIYTTDGDQERDDFVKKLNKGLVGLPLRIASELLSAAALVAMVAAGGWWWALAACEIFVWICSEVVVSIYRDCVKDAMKDIELRASENAVDSRQELR